VKHYKHNYPGDPTADVYQMSRQEFLTAHPRRPITFSNPITGEVYKAIRMGPDEIHCDLCNRDPGEVIYLYRLRSIARGVCQRCFDECWKQYCQEV
jgi:hypothetical protein